MYSNRFYASYSIIGLAYTKLGESTQLGENAKSFIHNFVGGVRMGLNSNIEIIPNTFIKYSEMRPIMIDLGLRANYQQNLMMGLSYRNDQSIIAMFGLIFKNIYTFNYSYESKAINTAQKDLSSHELTIGVQLFNKRNYKPLW